MAEALTIDRTRLELMGRVGAALIAEQHNIFTQAKKLAGLFANLQASSSRLNGAI
jgi:hypothetical protein